MQSHIVPDRAPLTRYRRGYEQYLYSAAFLTSMMAYILCLWSVIMLLRLHKQAQGNNHEYGLKLRLYGRILLVTAIFYLVEGVSLLVLEQNDVNICLRQIYIIIGQCSLFPSILLTQTPQDFYCYRKFTYTCFAPFLGLLGLYLQRS
jgi:hypothetical protein